MAALVTSLFGSEFNPASKPVIAPLSDGGFIVVWHAPDISGRGVYAQRLDQFGQQVGSEFRVNAAQSGNQENPVAVGLPDGSFFIAWRSDQNFSTSGGDIYAVRYDYLGSKSYGPEFMVNTIAAGNQAVPALIYTPALTTNTNGHGDLSVVWTTVTATGTGSIWYREYGDYNGDVRVIAADQRAFQPLNPVIPFVRNLVALEGRDGAGDYYVAGAITKDYLLKPNSDPQEGTSWTDQIASVMVFDGKSTVDPLVNLNLETLVNGGTVSLTDHVHSYVGGVGVLPGGGFGAIWTQWDDTAGTSVVYAQGFNHSGQPDLTKYSLLTVAENAKHGTSAVLEGGDWVTVWVDTETSYIKAKVYRDTDNSSLTKAFDIPDSYQYIRPRVAPTADGGFIITAEFENSVPLQSWMVTPLDLIGNLDLTTLQVTGNVLNAGSETRSVLAKGDTGNDSITTGSGSDVLDGGGGNDTLAGGTGDDTYIVRAGTVTLTEGSGAGIDTVQVDNSLGNFTLPDNLENLVYPAAGSGAFAGTGNQSDNDIKSGGGSDTLAGGTGNDTLSSGKGDDKLDGGDGSNLMDGGAGTDTATLNGKISDFGVTIIKIGNKTPFTLNGASAEDIVALTAGNGRVDRMVHVEKIQFDGDGGGQSFDVSGTSTTLSGARTVKVARYLSDDDAKSSLVGTSKSEAIDGLDGDDTLKGNAGNDALFGRGGVDSLDGGTGDDTLDGGVGADTLNGGTGRDIYIIDASDTRETLVEAATGGVDTVSTSLTSFSLAADTTSASGDVANIEILEHVGDTNFTGTGNARANVIISGSGNDSLDGGAGNDKLDGKAGNDTLNGGAGADILIGGAGDNLYIVDNAGDTVTEGTTASIDTVQTGLAAYSLAGLATVENLRYDKGTRAADAAFSGTGNAVNNSITGGTGNDKLNGGRGDDILTGGLGNDTLTGGDATGFVGTDTVVLAGNLADYTFSRVTDTALNPVVLATKGSEIDTLIGIERIVFADVPAGRLLSKDDLLLNTGSPFTDTYIDDDKTETVTSFSGLAGNDLATGGSRANSLDGGDGNDTLIGGASNDTLSGGAGNDSLDGGTGDDSMSGGKGDDIYVVEAAGDVLVENAREGTDTISTSLASYNLADKAAQVEKLIYTGTAAFTGTGNDLNNSISGNAGNDTLNGGVGADKLTGGAGDDTYVIDRATLVLADGTVVAGDSVVELAGEGTDIIKTSLASYSLAALANVETLIYDKGTGALDVAFNGTGNDANNNLTGGSGNDKLNGGKGDDTLTGGAGNDTLTGGDATGFVGTDTVVLAGNLADYTFSRVTDTVLNPVVLATKGSEVDTLIGIERIVFADVPAGRLLSKDDLLLNTGSPFADTYLDDDKTETVTSFSGLAGNDLATGGSRANSLDGGDGNDTLIGGAGNDTLSGGAGNDSLDGGTGDDSMSGGKGDDSYVVEAANDVVTENALEGTDSISTSLASYNLADKAAQVEKLAYTGASAFTGTGNDLSNSISGNAGNDSLVGGLGADTLSGGSGNDTLDGGDAADRLEGGAGDDSYRVDRPSDLVKETDATGSDMGGTDTIRAQAAGSYVLPLYVENFVFDATGNVTATGNANGNEISGGDGNDTLYGLAGTDTLVGGAGNDRLSGGTDVDHFRFTTALDASNNVDTIMDFGVGGVNDAIDLSSSIFSSSIFNGSDLDPSYFYKGTSAQLLAAAPVDERIIYNLTTGQLWYDADGAGDAVKVLFATIAGNKAALAATDFHIVA